MSKANVWCNKWYLRKNQYVYHMCTYKTVVIGAKTLEIIFISDYRAHGLLLQMFDKFPNTVSA